MGRPPLMASQQQVVRDDDGEVQAILDSFPQYVTLVDADHTVVMANRSIYKTFGLTPEQLLGEYCPRAIHGLEEAYPGCPVEEAHSIGKSVERELFDEATQRWMKSAAYVTSVVTQAGLPVYLHVVEDITEKKRAAIDLADLRARLEEAVAQRTRELQETNRELQREITERERAEDTIRQLAYYDPLTGLPNRTNFSGLLTRQIESARERGKRVGLALLDLDGFKTVNDTAGHDAGDKLLRLVGRRLGDATRAGDVAARMGGDEFLFVLADIDDEDSVESIAQRLLAVFDRPFSVGGKRFKITGSIGVAVYPEDGEDEVTLMKRADLAMYQAKGEGGSGVRRFQSSAR